MVPPPVRPSLLASSDRSVDLDPPLLSPRPRSWSASQRAMGYEVDSPAAAERMLQAHFGLGDASHGCPEDETSSSGTTTTPSGWPGSNRSSNEIAPRSDSSSSAYHSAPSQPSPPASPLPGSPDVLSPSPQSAAARQVLATLASMTRRPREDEEISRLEGDWGPLGRTRGRSLSVLEERTEEATSAGGRTGSHRQGSGGESERAMHSVSPARGSDPRLTWELLLRDADSSFCSRKVQATFLPLPFLLLLLRLLSDFGRKRQT